MGYPTFTIEEIAQLQKQVSDNLTKFHDYVSHINEKANEEQAPPADTYKFKANPDTSSYMEEQLKQKEISVDKYNREIVLNIITSDVVNQFLENRKLRKS